MAICTRRPSSRTPFKIILVVWQPLDTQICRLQVKRVLEEEWSYIPVGGPLPVNCQPVTAFGAAANLVHPATGYSIVRR